MKLSARKKFFVVALSLSAGGGVLSSFLIAAIISILLLDSFFVFGLVVLVGLASSAFATLIAGQRAPALYDKYARKP